MPNRVRKRTKVIKARIEGPTLAENHFELSLRMTVGLKNPILQFLLKLMQPLPVDKMKKVMLK